MLVGNAGTGKSVLMGDKLESLSTDDYLVQAVPFNFYTTSAMLQGERTWPHPPTCPSRATSLPRHTPSHATLLTPLCGPRGLWTMSLVSMEAPERCPGQMLSLWSVRGTEGRRGGQVRVNSISHGLEVQPRLRLISVLPPPPLTGVLIQRLR